MKYEGQPHTYRQNPHAIAPRCALCGAGPDNAIHKPERERILDGLVDVAISVLHHDTTDGSEIDQYERGALRKRFVAVLDTKRSK